LLAHLRHERADLRQVAQRGAVAFHRAVGGEVFDFLARAHRLDRLVPSVPAHLGRAVEELGALVRAVVAVALEALEIEAEIGAMREVALRGQLLEIVVPDGHAAVGVQPDAAGLEPAGGRQGGVPTVDRVADDAQVVQADGLAGVGDVHARVELDGGEFVHHVMGDDVVAHDGPAAGLGIADLDSPPARLAADVAPAEEDVAADLPAHTAATPVAPPAMPKSCRWGCARTGCCG
jgi:hypothetical protein